MAGVEQKKGGSTLAAALVRSTSVIPLSSPSGFVFSSSDRALRTGLRCTDLLDPDCVTVPAGDGGAVLEVKWDEFLPDVIRRAVQLPGCRTSAFSKYAACRVFD